MIKKICPVCRSEMRLGLFQWHGWCPACLYEGSDLRPAINESSVGKKIDEDSREDGLRSLRVANFNRLIRAIDRSGKREGSLLDVGCAHGWFLELAKAHGFHAEGIEPDEHVGGRTARRGLSVRQGFFPGVLSESERFDVITFNDVFEHLPDLDKVLGACKQHLKPDGLLVLNLPSSAGIFYKLSRVLAKVGISSFFERLWQKDLPSPHLHYFHPGNLRSLLQSNGFDIVESGSLPTIRYSGLYTRISYDSRHSAFVRFFILLGVALTLPVLSVMPKDIVYVIARPL